MTEPSMPDGLTARLCSKCSMQSQSAGDFCPHCGASYVQRRRAPEPSWIIAAVVALTLIVAAGTGVALKVMHDSQQTSSEDLRSFSVDEVDLSFDLPSDWEEFDPDKASEAMSDGEEIDQLADRLGMSVQQFQQMMASSMVLFITAPHAVDGFLSNVNVVVTDGVLPTLGAIELQYRTIGATDIGSEEVRTDLGDAYSTAYTLEVNGGEAHGKAILFALDGQIVNITVSSHDASQADSLANDVARSLARSQ